MATYSDAFTYSDGVLSTVSSGAWTDRNGSMNVVSNQFAETTGTNTYCEVAAATADFSDDHEATITASALGTSDFLGPACRVSASGCYALKADGTSNSSRRMVRMDTTTLTVIGTVNIVPTAGQTMKIRASGSTITAYVNGSLVDTVTDSTFTTGQPGIYYSRGNNHTSRGDTFQADDLVATPTLTDFNTTETFTAGATNLVGTGTNLASCDGLGFKTGTKTVAFSFDSAAATTIQGDAPSVPTMIAAGIKFGAGTILPTIASVAQGTGIAVTAAVSAAWQTHNVSDISQAADPECIYYGWSAAAAVGDQVTLGVATATYGWTVTIDSQGFVSFAANGDRRTDTVTYYAWDATDETGSAVKTIEIACVPVVGSVTVVAIDSATVDFTVTTDVDEGTVWIVVTPSATTPSHAQIKAGQNHLGAAATFAANSTSPAFTTPFTATGLSPGTTYYAHATQENAASTPDAAAPISSSAFAPWSTESSIVLARRRRRR